MRRFRDIVEDIKAPSPQSLWLDNGKLKFFGTKGWVSMVGEGDDDRQELEEKVDNLDKEVGSIQKDVAVLNSKATIELEIGNSENVKANNLAKLQAIQSVDHLFFADIDYGYGAAKWLPTTGGEAFIVTSSGRAVIYNIATDGSVTKVSTDIDLTLSKYARLDERNIFNGDNYFNGIVSISGQFMINRIKSQNSIYLCAYDKNDQSSTKTYVTNGELANIGTEEALTFTLKDGSTVTKKIRVLSNTTTPAT